MGCAMTQTTPDNTPRRSKPIKGRPNYNQDPREFQNYQRRIRKDRNDKGSNNNNDDYDSEDDEIDAARRRINQNTQNRRKGKKNINNLRTEDMEEDLLQDFREMKKRKNRKQKISQLQKEVPFKHREKEEPYDPRVSKPFKIGYEEEIYNGINYGVPIQLYNQTWLTIDCKVDPDTHKPQVEIPPGWRIPTLDDYKTLIKWAGSNEKAKILMTHPRLLKMDPSLQYITSTKAYPSENNGYNNKAWMFYCIAFDREDDAEGDQEQLGNGGIAMNETEVGFSESDRKRERKKKKNNKDKEDTVISEGDETIDYGNSEFVYQMKKQLKENKEIYQPVDMKTENKRKPKTPVMSSMLIDDDDEEGKMIFEYNPLSIYEKAENRIKALRKDKEDYNEEDIGASPIRDSNEETQPKSNKDKIIYCLDTFALKQTIRCKLISNKVLDLSFKCPLVIERNFRAFFEVPALFNITTFEWHFNDKYCPPAKNKSNKFVACHVFKNPGEYNIELEITLFSNRYFHIQKKVWVIDEIEYGDEEVIDGINYGQPIKFGNQIWLDRDLTFYENFKNQEIDLHRGKGPGIHGENSFLDSICACPNGWRLPYKEEVEELLHYAGCNDDQRLFFFTMLEGGFNAEVSESGFYDAICLSFKTKEKKRIENRKTEAATVSSADISKNESKDKDSIDKELIDPQFIKKLRNYDKLILNSLNFGDIYQKEAYSLCIENNKVLISTRTTSLNSAYSFFSTRCIADDNLVLDLGLKDDSFPVNFEIPFNIDYPNVEWCEWDFGDGSQREKNKPQITHAYKKVAEYDVRVKIDLFGGRKRLVKKHINIYADNDAIGEDTKLISADQVLVYNIGELYKAQRVNGVHFSNQIAPIAPLSKENGFYIAFNDMQDNNMKVFKILLEKLTLSINESFKKPFYTLYNGVPCDIVCVPTGAVLLMRDLRDENTLYVMSITEDGRVLWRNNIMQNGAYPLKAEPNQLLFYDNTNEKIEFGMNAMFKPYSGRLAFGQGKIICIFSYMNNFGVANGQRHDNNGDTIVTYSLDGSEVHLVSAWSTTHSLAQRAWYDGRFLYTASLGDCGPSNVKVLRVEPSIKLKLDVSNLKVEIQEMQKEQEHKETGELQHNQNDKNPNAVQPEGELDIKFDHYFPLQNRIRNNKDLVMANDEYELDECDYLKNLDNFKKSEHMTMSIRHNYIYGNMINGCVPSDLVGQSCGRFGSVTQLQMDRFAMVYSRIPCIDGGLINKANEFSTVLFNAELKIIGQAIYKTGDLINCIKQARYGRNLFVLFSETKRCSQNNKYLADTVNFVEDALEQGIKPCKCFLANISGKKISQLIGFDANMFSPSDDMETLKDGSVVWVFSDDENNLYLCMLCTQKSVEICERFSKELIPAGQLATFFAEKGENVKRLKREKEIAVLKSMGIDEEEEERRRQEIIEMERKKKEEEERQKQMEKEVAEEEEFRKKEEEEKKKKAEEDAKRFEEEELEEVEEEEDEEDEKSEDDKDSKTKKEKKDKQKKGKKKRKGSKKISKKNIDEDSEEDPFADVNPDYIPEVPIYGNRNTSARRNNPSDLGKNYYM